MAVYDIADAERLAELIGLLFDREVQVTPADTPSDTAVTGLYVDRDGQLGAACRLDLALANYAGAALSLVPPDVAAESVEAGELLDNAEENLAEVFNVWVGFFNAGKVPHIRFDSLTLEALPLDSARRLAGRAAHYRVDVAGYGAGLMTLAVA